MNHDNPEAAEKWQKLYDEYRSSDTMRQSILDLAASENGDVVIDKARQKWVSQGFEKAPFDFIFDELN